MTVLLIGGIGMSGMAMASDVLAEVNGVKITKEEANAFIRRAQPGQPALNFDLLGPKDRKAIVDRLVERQLFADAAKKSGIEKDPGYQKALKAAREELMIQNWLKKQYDKTIISDSEAREYYEKNQAKFQVPEQVHARHILLKDEKSAKEVIAQLKGLKGEELKKKFIELAKSKSTGPTGPKGGDLGYFARQQMVLPFAKAAFALKKGEITTEPVKTQFGWHVIYLEDRKPAEKIPFDKVRGQIVQALKQKHFEEKMKQEVERLKSEAKVSYSKELEAKAPEKK